MLIALLFAASRSLTKVPIAAEVAKWMAVVGKLVASGSYTGIYVIAAEIYPASVRRPLTVDARADRMAAAPLPSGLRPPGLRHLSLRPPPRAPRRSPHPRRPVPQVRATGMGCCLFFARAGGILAPQALQLGPEVCSPPPGRRPTTATAPQNTRLHPAGPLTPVVPGQVMSAGFGGLALASGLGTLLLPETLGRTMD